MKGRHIIMVHKEIQVRIIRRLVNCPIPKLKRIHLAAAVEHSIEDLSVHASTGVWHEAFSLLYMILIHQSNECLLIWSSRQPTPQLAELLIVHELGVLSEFILGESLSRMPLSHPYRVLGSWFKWNEDYSLQTWIISPLGQGKVFLSLFTTLFIIIIVIFILCKSLLRILDALSILNF